MTRGVVVAVVLAFVVSGAGGFLASWAVLGVAPGRPSLEPWERLVLFVLALFAVTGIRSWLLIAQDLTDKDK